MRRRILLRAVRVLFCHIAVVSLVVLQLWLLPGGELLIVELLCVHVYLSIQLLTYVRIAAFVVSSIFIVVNRVSSHPLVSRAWVAIIACGMVCCLRLNVVCFVVG